MARQLLIFGVLVIIFVVSQLTNQQEVENAIQKTNESSIIPNSITKSKTLQDYQTRYTAYKDLIESRCLLERFSEDNLTNNNIQKNGKNNSPKILYMSKRLSKREIYRLAGSRISEFCKGFPTYLINEISSTDENMEGYLNDLPDDDEISMEKVRIKRESPRHYFVGRIRGQTQSQYLNFGKGSGNNDAGGKAEAESSDQGSKAIVSGSSGMGQAQSQSMPSGCEGCPGFGGNTFDQEQGLQFGREHGKPGYPSPGEIRRPYDGIGQHHGAGDQSGRNYGQVGTGGADQSGSDQSRPTGQAGDIYRQPGGSYVQPSAGGDGRYDTNQRPYGRTDGSIPQGQVQQPEGIYHTGHPGSTGNLPYQPGQQGGQQTDGGTYGPTFSGHPGSLTYQPSHLGPQGQVGGQQTGGESGHPQNIGVGIQHPVVTDTTGVRHPGLTSTTGIQQLGPDRKPISSGPGLDGTLYPTTQGQTIPGQPIQYSPHTGQTSGQTGGIQGQPTAGQYYIPGQGYYTSGQTSGQIGQQVTRPTGEGDGRYVPQGYQTGQTGTGTHYTGGRQQEGTFHGQLSGGYQSHTGSTSGRFSGTFSGKYAADGHEGVPGEIRDDRILTGGQVGSQGGGSDQQTYNQDRIGTGQIPAGQIVPGSAHTVTGGSQQGGSGQSIQYPGSTGYVQQVHGGTGTQGQAGGQRPISTGPTSTRFNSIQPGQSGISYPGTGQGTGSGFYPTGSGQYGPAGQTRPYYQTDGQSTQYGPSGGVQPSTSVGTGTGQYRPIEYGSNQYGHTPTGTAGGYEPTGGGNVPPSDTASYGQDDRQYGQPNSAQYGQTGGQYAPTGSGHPGQYGAGQYGQGIVPTSGQHGQGAISGQYGQGNIPTSGQYGPSTGIVGGVGQHGTTGGIGTPQAGQYPTGGSLAGGTGADGGLGSGQYSPQTQYGQTGGAGYAPTQQGQTGSYYGSNVSPGNLERRPDTGLGQTGADDSDSQVQASVQQSNNETLANAQAQGKYLGGTAQSQVSGTYSGSGSFSASAGSDDGKRGALTQVSGGKSGAQSSAQGRGGKGQSQAQVVLSSETGDTIASSQSGGHQHGTQSQVQANNKGGMADAQANGPGSTSSQAQIGFTPYDEHEKDDQKTPFRGGGTASAQGGTYSGLTQSQIQGQFQKGIRYTGAAQAGSGAQGVNWNITRPEGFQPFKPIKFSNKPSTNTQKQVTSVKVSDPVHLDKRNGIQPIETEDSQTRDSKRSMSTVATTTEENPTTIPNDDYDEEDYEEYEDTTVKTRSIISQDSKSQKQHIVLDPLENLDATVYQSKGDDFPADGTVLQPGQSIPGSPGYQIPQGFRGRVKSIASGPNTYTIGKNSQAQSVYLTPGSGRIYYKKPIYAASSKTLLRNGRYAYGSGYSYQPTQYAIKTAKSLPNFVSSIRSESGYRDLKTGEKSPNVYYTQSSTCGMFTHTCIYKDGKKLCMPRLKTNPNGLPAGC